MLQNASLLAIVAVDTDENEPFKHEVWWVRRHFWGAHPGDLGAAELDDAGGDEEIRGLERASLELLHDLFRRIGEQLQPR